MKLDTTRRDVETDGMLKQRAFTIQNGAHIMQVLSGLYSNPVDAMVREYLTNMYDAHMALPAKVRDTVKKPELHLPTTLDPNLRFIDYGVGMSEETVWEVYTQYGNSTKNGTNKQVGGFGLGSKTAFCYNGGSSWIVESRYKGKKHVFMAFVGEDSVPNMTHVSSEDTTDPNGVSVIIPIRREDVPQTITSAQKYVPYFPLPIEVFGLADNAKNSLKAINYSMKGKNWSVRASDPYSRHTNTGTTIVMGNVPYVLDWRQMHPSGGNIWGDAPFTTRLVKFVPTARTANLASFFTYNQFDLFVDIGSCDIVPSRDGLKYTDKTRKTIMDAIVATMSEIPDMITQQLAGCKTEWEALTKYQSLTVLQYLDQLSLTFQWNGKDLNVHEGVTRKFSDFKKLDPKATVTLWGIKDGSAPAAEDLTAHMKNLVVPIRRVDRYGTAMVGQSMYILIDDMPKGGMVMAKSLVTDKFCRRDYGGRLYSYGHTPGYAIILENTKLTAAEISDFFGGMPTNFVSNTSGLANQGITVPLSLRPIKDTVYKWSPARERFEARVQKPSDKAAKFYLPLEKNGNGRYTFRSSRHDVRSRVTRILELANSFGIIKRDSVIYGIKNELIKDLDSTWKNIADAVEAEIPNQLKSIVEPYAYTRSTRHTHNFDMIFKMVKEFGLEKEPEFQPLIDFKKKLEDSEKQVHLKNHIINVLTDTPKANKDFEALVAAVKIPDIQKTITDIKSKFPMIGIVIDLYADRYHYNSIGQNYRKEMLDYLKDLR
jgi:hypothetical protein